MDYSLKDGRFGKSKVGLAEWAAKKGNLDVAEFLGFVRVVGECS